MGLQIRPLWDPTGTVSVEVHDDRRELVVSTGGDELRFTLREDRPDRLGWVEQQVRDGRVRRCRRVAVGDVVCHCLREWDAEQEVLALSEQAAGRALERGGHWAAPGRRLADQARAARRRKRVSTLPFQVLFAHRSGSVDAGSLTAAVAAARIDYRMADGRSDTQRLLRRFGLACHRDGRGGQSQFQRSVRYETGVALCRAVAVDPVELGL